jgi:hypothetical protein
MTCLGRNEILFFVGDVERGKNANGDDGLEMTGEKFSAAGSYNLRYM